MEGTADGSGDQLISTYNARGKDLTRKTVALSGGNETMCFTFTDDPSEGRARVRLPRLLRALLDPRALPSA
jgi:hypothetical protein